MIKKSENPTGTPSLSRRSFMAGVAGAVPFAVLPLAYGTPPKGNTFKNEAYQVRVLKDGTVELASKGGAARTFTPKFNIMYRSDDPGLSYNNLIKEANFYGPGWKSLRGGKKTQDLYEAAQSVFLQAQNVEVSGSGISWSFPSNDLGSLEAKMTLPAGGKEPQVEFRFTPTQVGWYSVGFVGAPEMPPDQIESIWQPFVWQERRFPLTSYLSMPQMCPVPTTLVAAGGVTVGVAADPIETGFGVPVAAHGGYGVLLRNSKGNAQPQIYAPVLGHPYSKLEPHKPFVFRFRLLVTNGGTLAAHRTAARSIYGFSDYRQNGTCSLNETLDNITDLIMDDYYSGWAPDIKGFAYSDVRDTVKIVSSMHPLSLALIRDRMEIYIRRALPMIEYMMSRQKYLFAKRADIDGQSASHSLKGPCAEVSELASLYLMSQERSSVFSYYAKDLYDKPRSLNLDMVSKGGRWQNSLALYRMTNDRGYLEKAKAGADAYIESRIDHAQTDFSDVHIDEGGQFWTDFAPKWVDLLELYEETRERRYLAAAATGASLYTQYVWLHPSIPNKEILVNEGGIAHTQKLKRAPEERVPAWRLSAVGLTPEASTTYTGNPAVLLACYAPYMLRLAHYTGETFFRDIARSAVVGRYCNYPGYSIMGGPHTTIYQRPDFPLHPLVPDFPDDWTDAAAGYAAYYYNHIFPQIAMLFDYLISDVFTRSGGKINFPPRYAEGYAYLANKVYGDRPGTFYGENGVYLWMPRDLLRCDNAQINYVSGYGNGKFYLALLNESDRQADVKLTLHPDIVPVDIGRTYNVKVRKDNRPSESISLRRGEMETSVMPKSITALVVEDIKITTQFQERIFGEQGAKLSDQAYITADTPLGKVTGMLISFGPSLTSAYVWLEASDAVLKEARLSYKQGNSRHEISKPQYPFEFTILLGQEKEPLEFSVEGLTVKDELLRTTTLELKW